MEMNYASKGVAGSGLGLGIAGTALSLLNGGLGGILGGGWGNNGYGVCSENVPVNRYELNQQAEITRKETEIAYLKGRDAAKNDMLDLYEKLDGRFRAVEGQIAAQAVVNANTNGVLACLQGQVAALNNLTKVVIPAANICPAPMPQYNSWTAPTTTPTTAG